MYFLENKTQLQIIFVLSVLILNNVFAENFSKEKISFREYLGYSIIGSAVSILPAAYIGRTYYSEKACRERGEDCDPFIMGSRILAIAFTLGSSTATAIYSHHKWQVFALTLTANSIPIVLMYKNFSFLLGFYSLSIPVISAIIGFKFDSYRENKKSAGRDGLIILPNIFIHNQRIHSGVSVVF